ncbi:helix-turn-helix domain-containing protein [Rhodohalobacter sp. 614A]|uniref:helix-turn-helix domain-containing protein n=1 Tax=Rhodohalobacter sp. 614A TaxID=2908649 RepID=UPI001F45C02E|nr:AraC family transcriptional regulator [Rhodohalobacter sp. 614A]
MMNGTDRIKSCYVGPEISPEQFISEHYFFYMGKGSITGYDGHQAYHMKTGEYCIIRKNHLARYKKMPEGGTIEKVVIVLDELFLRDFQKNHEVNLHNSSIPDKAFLSLKETDLIPNYIQSLMPYYEGHGEIDEAFSKIKREELLLILLKTNPDLSDILFDFGTPEKIDLKAFMNQNYAFNVNLERFAYLTGRSLSAFKRDFKKIFNETPGRWLVKKRLQQAYFLITEKMEKPSEIYLDLGFEDFSHFSYAFKKRFGHPPTQLLKSVQHVD